MRARIRRPRAIVERPGQLRRGPTCDYTGGRCDSASCTVTITSATTGTTVVSATSNDPGRWPVDHRARPRRRLNTTAGGTDNASKKWVDANIAITPATATNAVGTNHVLTITVNAVNGTLAAGTATATIVSGPGSFVGGDDTCDYAGGAATASCTVTITLARRPGRSSVSATSTIPVDGQTITRTTGTAANTTAGGSDNASKKWVDANIAITPATATNATGTNHVLTITVNAVERDARCG